MSEVEITEVEGTEAVDAGSLTDEQVAADVAAAESESEQAEEASQVAAASGDEG